ncbi:MAG: hypothetical protein ACQ5SW_00235, partial [Sphaerochaetaceae bacterium]
KEGCTILVQSEDKRIIINPSMRGDIQQQQLYNKSGVFPCEIDEVYCTVADPAYMVDIEIYKNAVWYMPETVYNEVRRNMHEFCEYYVNKFHKLNTKTTPFSVETFPIGKKALTGLSFDTREGTVLILNDFTIPSSETFISDLLQRFSLIITDNGIIGMEDLSWKT